MELHPEVDILKGHVRSYVPALVEGCDCALCGCEYCGAGGGVVWPAAVAEAVAAGGRGRILLSSGGVGGDADASTSLDTDGDAPD
jgi:hypothetical protein